MATKTNHGSSRRRRHRNTTTQSRPHKIREAIQQRNLGHVLLFAAVACALFTIIFIGEQPIPLRAGDILENPKRARVTFSFEDHPKRDRLMLDAIANQPNLYIVDNKWGSTRLNEIISALKITATEKLSDKVPELLRSKGITIGSNNLDILRSELVGLSEENLLSQYITPLENTIKEAKRLGVISQDDYDREKSEKHNKKLELRNEEKTFSVPLYETLLANNTNTTNSRTFTSVLKMRLAHKSTPLVIRDAIASEFGFLGPNISFDQQETERLKTKSANDIPAQFTRLSKGSLMIPAGRVLEDYHIDMCYAHNSAVLKSFTTKQRVMRIISLASLTTLLLSLFIAFAWRIDPVILSHSRRLANISLLILSSFAVAKMLLLASTPHYIIPIGLIGGVIAMAWGSKAGMITAAFAGIYFGILSGMRIDVALIHIATGMIFAMRCERIEKRNQLWSVGIVAGIVAGVLAFGVDGWAGFRSGQNAVYHLSFGVIGGITTGVLLSGILPLIERWLEIATDVSLLEICDRSHPARKRLMLEAPGTFDHSSRVATLAEAGAEAIDARVNLCLAGAYFHDLGKSIKPEYFAENQTPGHNRHDDLSPHMSTMIIIGHVKDGQELLAEYKLPQSVIDLGVEHHGTTVIKYFYDKALRIAKKELKDREDSKLPKENKKQKKKSDEPNESLVDDSFYRYPGPKPQSCESGILMLADSLEALSRSLEDPTPQRIKSAVHSIVMEKLLDGQLDESGLSLTDIHKCEEAFIRTLVSMFHMRPKYPGQDSTTSGN